jgi:adenosylcobinamide-GDP ribazoletransferase
MRKMLLAVQFLTIFPVRDMGELSDQEMGRVTAYFPLAGMLEGIFLTVLAWLCLKVFPGDLTSGLVLFAMVVINGGLHLDGLSDTCDAVASRGDTKRKLAIMKESTIGPAGVIAIVLVILLQYLLLNALFSYSSTPVYYTGLVLMPVLSRCTMVWAIFHSGSARQSGLGRMFIEHTGLKELIVATVLTLVICICAFGIISHYALLAFHLMFVLPILYFFSLSAVWFFNKYFGGMTGDSFGAVYEIAILLFLTTRIIWSQKFI